MIEKSIIEDRTIQSATIDLLRFVLAAFVVMIHVDGGMISNDYSGVWHNGLFDAFHILFAQGICRVAVPTFFLISGFLFFSNFKNWDRKIYWCKIKKRARSVLVPYLMWNIIAIAVFVTVKEMMALQYGASFSIPDFFSKHGGLRMLWDDVRMTDDGAVNILGVMMHNGYPFNGPLWFLRDLFIIMVLSPLVQLAVRYGGVLLYIILSSLMVFNIWVPVEGLSSVAFFFFYFGALLRIKGVGFIATLRRYEGLSYVMSVILLFLSVLFYGQNEQLYYIFQRSFTIFGSVAIINIAGRCVGKPSFWSCPAVMKSSFFIYAGQRLYVIPLAVAVVQFILPVNWQVVLIMKYVLASFLVVMICFGAYSFMKKCFPGLLRFLVGGRTI